MSIRGGDGIQSFGLPQWALAIRAWRIRNGWEQKELARRLNLLDRTCRCDHVTVSRWERGLQKPTPIYEELLCTVFEGAILHGYADPLKRREFVRMAALGGVGMAMDLDRVLSILSRRSRPDATALDELEILTREYERLYWTVRPASMLPAADNLLTAIRGLLTVGPSERLARRTTRLAGEMASLCGWLAVRLNRRDDAVMYLALALELADEANAPHLRAHGLVAMRALCSPLIADDRHANAARALALVNEAADHLGPDAPALLRTEVFACRAEELAMADQAVAAGGDLDRADSALAQARTPSTDFFSDWNAVRLSHYRGTCAVLLHQPTKAIPLLQAAIDQTSVTLVAPYTAALVDLAAAYAQEDEVQRCCELLEEVLTLAARAGMPQRVHRIRRTRRRHLERWAGAAPVRQLDELLRQHQPAR